MNKSKLQGQAGFSDKFREELAKKKDYGLGDAVGLPDNEDKERIRRYLLRYDKANPGVIKFARDEAKKQHKAVGGRTAEFGEVNKAAHGRVLFELPEEIGHWMETAYPLMFRDKKHLAWFCKNFPELLVPERY